MQICNRVVAVVVFILTASFAIAADQDSASKAAANILASLQNKQYEKLWDTQTSRFFKSKLTKDSFLANMNLGRQALGALKSSKFIDMAYSNQDPTTGITGEIYAFNYRTAYASGEFYERIVVIKEDDGVFRMSGLWGAPAAK